MSSRPRPALLQLGHGRLVREEPQPDAWSRSFLGGPPAWAAAPDPRAPALRGWPPPLQFPFQGH